MIDIELYCNQRDNINIIDPVPIQRGLLVGKKNQVIFDGLLFTKGMFLSADNITYVKINFKNKINTNNTNNDIFTSVDIFTVLEKSYSHLYGMIGMI